MRLNPTRYALFVAIIVAAASSNSFANANLLSVDATPYDRQMTPIRAVLTSSAASSDEVALSTVNDWIADLREIPYQYQVVWRTPGEVESRQPADCKGKAVALYRRMRTAGATDLRLIIGKRAPSSRVTHAWLEWQTPTGTYTLDPTFNYAATRTEKLAKGCYVPLYAYAGAKKFQAVAGALVAQN